MLFIALTIPHFGIIASLVGASACAAANFILPSLFYLMLTAQNYSDETDGPLPNRDMISTSKDVHHHLPWERVEVPLWEKVVLIQIIVIALVGGIAATYSTIYSIVDGSSSFTLPCYVNWSCIDNK